MPTKLTDAFKVSMQDVNKTVPNEYATVTRVNSNKTVNVKPDSNDADSDDLTNISYVVDLDLSVGDRVVLSYLNNDPNEPIVMGMLNPKSSSNVDCRSIVSVDKVESDGLVDVYRITYDKAPIYSYFSVKNGGGEQDDPGETGVIPELAGKTVKMQVLIQSQTVTNTPSVIFSNLNGDEDEEYVIEAKLIGNSCTKLTLVPNPITIGGRSFYIRDVYGGVSGGAVDELRLAYLEWTATGTYINITASLVAKTGRWRYFKTKSFWEYLAQGNAVSHSADVYIKDTTTNITSLTINGNGNFSGTIKLYKMVDVTYPTN